MNQISIGIGIPVKKAKGIWTRLKKHSFVLMVMVPLVLHFLVFSVFPVFFSLFMSLFDWPIFGPRTFIGLDNWKNLLTDRIFIQSLKVTFLFTLYYVLPTIMLGLILALLINTKVRFANTAKAMFFLPAITSTIVISALWHWIFMGNQEGIMNAVLGVFGIPPQVYFSSPVLSLVVMALLSIYRVCGTTMVYYYAGLQGIPEECIESAHIDGSKGWHLFWNITFPLLKPTTLYVIIITTIGSLQIFDSAYILTMGGPNYATNTIVFNIYTEAFMKMRLGYANAIALILFLIILAITLVQYRTLDSDLSYN